MSAFLNMTRATFRKWARMVAARKESAAKLSVTIPEPPAVGPKSSVPAWEPYIDPVQFALNRFSAFKDLKKEEEKRAELVFLAEYIDRHQNAHLQQDFTIENDLPAAPPSARPNFMAFSEGLLLVSLQEWQSGLADDILDLSLLISMQETEHLPSQDYVDDVVDLLSRRCKNPFSEPLQYPLESLKVMQSLMERQPLLVTPAYVEMCCLYASIEPEMPPPIDKRNEFANIREPPPISRIRVSAYPPLTRILSMCISPPEAI